MYKSIQEQQLVLLGGGGTVGDRDRPIHLKPILTDTDSNRFWNF